MSRLNSIKRTIFFAVAILFLSGFFLAIGLGCYLYSPAGENNREVVFVVSKGVSLRHVADGLESKGLINSKPLFLFWAELTGQSRDIKAGEYKASPSMTPMDILAMLSSGKVLTHPITIPEGFTAAQIGSLLLEKGLSGGEAFMKCATDAGLARKYGLEGPGLEGYLYPDTYYFSRGLSSREIIDTMVNRFLEVFGSFRGRAKEVGMSMHEVVTLASIVEKETGLARERPIIASIFLNRLKKGMRLETDPTVIYGIKDFDGNLIRKDLETHTPYNTYLIKGLPPGPISNPGREAIHAVLFPAETDYLFFVSKNDGSHFFSETYAEHNRAVHKYQK